MAREIERKYLVLGQPWAGHEAMPLQQAYLSDQGKATVRLRCSGEAAWLTIKGRPAEGSFDRLECEYTIPLADAEQMIDELSCSSIIRKKRYTLDYQGHEWVIDVFEGDNAGLVVAEIELESEGVEFPLPPWAGEEVTFDNRFANSSLSKLPWKDFKHAT